MTQKHILAASRPLLQKLVTEDTFPKAYATDDGAALHYIDKQFYKAITDTPDTFVYHVTHTDSGVREIKLVTELLTR
jgi:dipeptidase E